MSDPVLPTSSLEKPVRPQVHAAFYIASWIFFSNLTILFNKWLIDNAGFRYPVILTCWHMAFACIATQVLAKTTHLLDGRHKVKMTGRVYLRAVVPIGLLYSGSLVCSNLVYLYLSVAFIQMLKAAAPVAVLFVGWFWGVSNPTVKTFLNIMIIVLGVILASAGEIQFSWIGFMFQVGGIVFEAMRLIMIQILLSGDDFKMDPLVSLYYYAPVCAVMNFIIALFTESGSFQWSTVSEVGPFILLLNASVAFMLNVASVMLIGKTSGLAMTLTGILKSILLVAVSVVIWSTKITFLQAFGYAVATLGLLLHSFGYEQLQTWVSDFGSNIRNLPHSPYLDENRMSPVLRRTLLILLSLAMALMIVYGLSHSDTVGSTTAVIQGAENLGQGWSPQSGA